MGVVERLPPFTPSFPQRAAEVNSRRSNDPRANLPESPLQEGGGPAGPVPAGASWREKGRRAGGCGQDFRVAAAPRGTGWVGEAGKPRERATPPPQVAPGRANPRQWEPLAASSLAPRLQVRRPGPPPSPRPGIPSQARAPCAPSPHPSRLSTQGDREPPAPHPPHFPLGQPRPTRMRRPLPRPRPQREDGGAGTRDRPWVWGDGECADLRSGTLQGAGAGGGGYYQGRGVR